MANVPGLWVAIWPRHRVRPVLLPRGHQKATPKSVPILVPRNENNENADPDLIGMESLAINSSDTWAHLLHVISARLGYNLLTLVAAVRHLTAILE